MQLGVGYITRLLSLVAFEGWVIRMQLGVGYITNDNLKYGTPSALAGILCTRPQSLAGILCTRPLIAIPPCYRSYRGSIFTC